MGDGESLGELRHKTLDNFENMLRDSAKRINDWSPSDGWASLQERYCRNDVRIHNHVTGGLEEFCAIFQHYPVTGLWQGRSVVSPKSEHRASRPSPHDDLKEPMLVSVVNLVKSPKGISFPPLPPLYGCSGSIGV